MAADLSTIRQHWDAQSQLGDKAGTQDLIAKQLEQRAILAGISTSDALLIMEVGCGRGETARRVQQECYASAVDAFDNSAAMIAEAVTYASVKAVNFCVGDVLDLPCDSLTYNVAYTQRCLINLPTWELQKQAIDAIANRLVAGGRYLMVEASQDGLNAINERRVSLGLSVIKPQREWNRYMRQHELSTVTSLRLREVQNFSATYYYNSRIANAYDAKLRGVEPDYNAPINRMALEQPADDVHPKFSQSRLWIWEKL